MSQEEWFRGRDVVSWRKLEFELMEIKPKSIIDRSSMVDWSDHLEVSRGHLEVSRHLKKHDFGTRQTWTTILFFLFPAV